MTIDIHQHVWTPPLVEALSRRREFPFVRYENGLAVLFLAGEQPYAIDLDGEAPARRAQLAEADGVNRALVVPSSPLGIEALSRRQAIELIDAYHDGALALGEPFGVWGSLALDALDPDDIDRALARGCVGISLPAGTLGNIDLLARTSPALARIQSAGVPLLVHPGPGMRPLDREASLGDPLWWPALTRYVSQMQAAWLTWVTAGRRLYPNLRIVFSMLAGLAPLHAERLLSRGGPDLGESADPFTFYDTSSYGPRALRTMEKVVGAGQLVYGSDRPVVDPTAENARATASRFAQSTARALVGNHQLVDRRGVQRGAVRTRPVAVLQGAPR
ncbi:MAG TPA: amidohydrolase family protein [Solirubrobacteraceae bacterium]|jgi:predicted TIM-barrel fold metal-dependent hydrolase